MGIVQQWRKILSVLLIILFLFSSAASAAPPVTQAGSAILMDVATGRVLWEQNARQRRPMASTTKIMTTIVALEYGNLSDMVTTSPYAASMEGSSIYLSPGEQLSLEDLLYGVMLASGNDAATAVAEHIAGSVENFARLMVAKAQSIGAMDTSFQNPHGLDAKDHYTTAYDLAKITAYGLKIPKFAEIVSTTYKTIPWPEKEGEARWLYNKNRLLETFPGADGVKTGYTSGAGRCLVSSATRDGWQLVAVVLDCDPMFEDSAALLEYGFSHFKPHLVVGKGELIHSVPVVNGLENQVAVVAPADFRYPVMPGEEQNLSCEYDLPKTLVAPLAPGQTVGQAVIKWQGKTLATMPLIAAHGVEKMPFVKLVGINLLRMFGMLINPPAVDPLFGRVGSVIHPWK